MKIRKKRGTIIVISAPSGSGKTTLQKRLIKDDRNIVQSISMTTRQPRSAERGGRDYYFITDKRFRRLIRQKRFLEWTRTYGYFYGTPRRFIEDSVKKGRSPVLSIDVKGAMQLKRSCPGALFIFLAPPSFKDLKKRLRKRNTERTTTIGARLKVAKKELTYIPKYDYVVVNDSVDKALAKLKAIITAERCRVNRKP